jgi:ketosteroid isomerase-like protein
VSQANVEIVREAYRAVNGEDVEALIRLSDPDVVYDVSRRTFDSVVYRGHDGVREAVALITEQWETLHVEPEEFRAAGDKVIVRVRLTGVGKHSGVETTAHAAHVWRLRDGTIVRHTVFQTLDDAIEAAGLPGEAEPDENIEVVRGMIKAFNSPDFDLEEWLDEYFDPEIEWHDVPSLPNAGVHFGRDAYRRHVADYLEAWAETRIEVEFVKAVGDRVVARIRYGGVGVQSGADVTGGASGPATGAVFEFRAGRIVRALQFITPAEALEVVGLSE